MDSTDDFDAFSESRLFALCRIKIALASKDTN